MKRALLVLAGLALGLGLVECALSGPLRPEVVHLRDEAWQARIAARDATIYQADAELVYAPRPGASFPMEYGPAAFNAQGLREDGPTPALPGDDLRLLMVGDSLVWGELLARRDAPPATLADALGPGHEVLNLGVTGYDTHQEVAWTLRAGLPLRPDLVVLVFCLNDLLIQSGPYHQHASAAQAAAYTDERAWLDARAPVRNETVSRLWFEDRRGDGSQVRAALAHAWRWHRLFTLRGGYVDEPLLALADPQRVDRLRAALATLGAALRERDTPGAVVISPALYWWHDYKWDALHAVVRAAATDAGLAVIEPLEAWRGGDPTPYRFPGDNLHYTAAGSRALGEVVATGLREQGLLERAALSACGSMAGPSHGDPVRAGGGGEAEGRARVVSRTCRVAR